MTIVINSTIQQIAKGLTQLNALIAFEEQYSEPCQLATLPLTLQVRKSLRRR